MSASSPCRVWYTCLWFVLKGRACVLLFGSLFLVSGIWCWRLRNSGWWQTYRICTAQHQLNIGPRRCFPTENPHVHIRNASVSLKKKPLLPKNWTTAPFLEALTFSLIGSQTFLKLPMTFTPFVNNSHVFVSVISNMQTQHVIACMFILLLPYFKEKYYWVRSRGFHCSDDLA